MAFDVPMELGITVGGDPEIAPRTSLVAVPFARALPGLYTVYREEGSNRSYNVVGGATNNEVDIGVIGATIGGGGGVRSNFERPNRVDGDWGTIGGGNINTAGPYATIGGGRSNTAGNTGATVPGGLENNARGQSSFAAGYHAKANHSGSFVWSDNSMGGVADTLASTADSQFLIRAAGGVGIGTNTPSKQLSVSGSADISDSLGVGTSSVEALLHVSGGDLGVGPGEIVNEGILLEKADAIIGAYSDNTGSWGSGIILAEMDADTLSTKWVVVRETQSSGNDLHFKYGSDAAYQSNTTQFEITNDGSVRSRA